MSSENILNLSSRKTNFIIFVILIFYLLVGMGIDLISPSLPAISRYFQVSSAFSKNLISIYLFGYAIGNFIVGFLSDAWGRRRFVLGGLMLFVVSSYLPNIFASSGILLFSRFLQGFGLAASSVTSRGILSDILSAKQLVRIAPVTAMFWGMGPVIGPVIGGYLQYYFNWQSCFYFFTIFGLISLISVFLVVPETHLNRHPLSIVKIKLDIIEILSHRFFVGAVMLLGLTYSILIVFNTLGPFLIQTELGRSPIYFGHVALVMGSMFLLGTMICRYLVKDILPNQILKISIPLFMLIALIALFIAFKGGHDLAIILSSTFFMFLCVGIIYPCSLGISLSLFRHSAGSAAAVMYLINILMTSLTAFIMGFINAKSAIPLVAIYFGLMVFCGLSYWFGARSRENANFRS